MAIHEDDALAPLSELMSAFTADILGGETSGLADEAAVESIAIELPLELDIAPGLGGAVLLTASPPLLRTETSVPPVLHTLRIVLSRS